ncbi:MAG: helix-turn-helix transcriptional regulator [Acidimicrobiales bacterium]|nr:helix-turn-helix transcriptional regulator [Acidimicrobiales bacterium]
MLGQRLAIPELKAEVFKALAHPARIKVLEVLCSGEFSVGELQPQVGIELTHLSQQLAILRKAGLVNTRKEGTSVFYSLRDPLVGELLRVAKELLISVLGQSQEVLADLNGSAVAASKPRRSPRR